MIADFSHGNEDCCGVVRLINGATSEIVNALEAINGNALTSPSVTGPGKEHYDESLSGDDPYDFQDDGASAELNWQLSNDVKLTDIVAYRDFSQTTNVNASFSGANFRPVPEPFHGSRVQRGASPVRSRGIQFRHQGDRLADGALLHRRTNQRA